MRSFYTTIFSTIILCLIHKSRTDVSELQQVSPPHQRYLPTSKVQDTPMNYENGYISENRLNPRSLVDYRTNIASQVDPSSSFGVHQKSLQTRYNYEDPGTVSSRSLGNGAPGSTFQGFNIPEEHVSGNHHNGFVSSSFSKPNSYSTTSSFQTSNQYDHQQEVNSNQPYNYYKPTISSAPVPSEVESLLQSNANFGYLSPNPSKPSKFTKNSLTFPNSQGFYQPEKNQFDVTTHVENETYRPSHSSAAHAELVDSPISGKFLGTNFPGGAVSFDRNSENRGYDYKQLSKLYNINEASHSQTYDSNGGYSY